MAADEKELITKLMQLCRDVVKGILKPEMCVCQIRELAKSNKTVHSLLFDVIGAVDLELKDGEKETFKNFCQMCAGTVIPEDALRLNIDNYNSSSDTNLLNGRLVKLKTRLYYKQLKFNLLREESEGYAKLISELGQRSLLWKKENSVQAILERLRCLIGQFNLDPNRVLDITLECIECDTDRVAVFVELLRRHGASKENICNLIGFKFTFYQNREEKNEKDNNNSTPDSLYKLTALLIREQLLDVLPICAYMWPVVENLVKDNLNRRKEAETKSRQAQVVSTAVLSELKEQDLASGSIAAVNTTLPSTSAVQGDGDSKPQDNVLATNQKLGLVCALLEIGEWHSAKDLMDRMPEFYAVSSSERIAKAMIRLVHWKIQAFYKLKCSSSNSMVKATQDKKNATDEDKKSLKKKRLRSALEADDMDVDTAEEEIHVEHIAQVHSWDGFVEAVFPLLHYLGPYFGYSAIVLSKVIRLLAVLMKNKDSKLVSRHESQVVDVVDQSVLPALTLLDGNCVISEELWSLIGQFPYTTRYRLYGHWVTEHTNRHPALLIMKGVVTGKTRYVMKRLAKETVRIVGRQLGKLCHTHPAVVFDHLLNQIQTFENFIGPVVDSVRYLTHLEFDVFSYCIIQHLASPEKQKLKVRDVTLSPWLQSLATFVGTVFKRYNMELTAVLQYVANQLKDGHSFDLLVLREVVQNMSGIETTSGLTSEQLEALAGGDILRQEGGYFGQSRNVKRTTNRLRDALYQEDLVLGLCILTAQQRGSIVHKESEGIHLKLTGQMLDQCQDTLIQFGSFLTTNFKADDYVKRMPTAPQLLIDYHVSTDAAMFLSRPIYRSQILSRYAELKKQEREKQRAAAALQNAEEQQQQSNVTSKNPECFRQSFNETVGRLVEKLVSLYPEHIWADISPRLFVTFWVLSMYDLFLPEDSYEREVEKIRKQVDEAASSRELSDSRRRKEKDRLQQLETKLKTEEASQKNHVARVVHMLEHEKDSWFTSAKTLRAEQVVRFIQTCVMPRCLFADLDAIYCVKFVELMHQLRTPKFPTILFLDRFLVDVTTLVPGLSENEATYFGRFLNALLKLIARWHSDRTVYEKECAGSPGFVTRYRNDQESAVDYESFRNVTYKWHHRLSKAFINMMTMKWYACRRNALYVLMKMLPTFPVVDLQYNCILKGAEDLRDAEKDQRQDLHILATSYWGHLKQRKTPQVVPQDEFHIMKNRKTTVSRANPTAASTAAPIASESAKPPATEAKGEAASTSVAAKTVAAKRTADKAAHNQTGLSNTEKRHEAGTVSVNRTATATKRTVTTATVEVADKAAAVQNGPGPKKKKQNGSVGEKSNQEGSVLPPTHRKIRLQSHGSAATAAGVQQSSTASGKTSSSAPSKAREDGAPAATTAEALSADGHSKDSTTRKTGGATSAATAATPSSGTTATVDEPEEGEEGEIRQSPMPHHSSNTRTILAGPATTMSRPVEPPASSSTKKRPSASPNERSSSAKKRLRKEQKNETTGHRSREASHDRGDKKRIRASSSRGKEDVVAAVTLVAAEASKSVSPADGRYGGRHAKEPSSEHRHRHSGPSSTERTKLAKRSKKEERRSRGQSAESRRSAKQR